MTKSFVTRVGIVGLVVACLWSVAVGAAQRARELAGFHY
jgi:hypothetical protein